MKFGFRVLTALAIAWGSPACADMTARYVMDDGTPLMTIEIAANGDMRTRFSDPSSYFLTREGRDYLVKTGPAGPIVMRSEDIATVMLEQAARETWRPPKDKNANAPLIARAKVRIRGRQGVAYASDRDPSPDAPTVVISEDPTLAPLASAIRKQFLQSLATMSSMFGDASPSRGIAPVLSKGAPLAFLGLELDTVSRDPVPASRFALPAPPITLDAVRRDFNAAP
ncbi:hypothetical protein SAMN05428984_1400 [Sphingomonas sp. OK281]|nr:hypothetical protein SAMN05428984_1400 [Sphingomonas sp. OK281]